MSIECDYRLKVDGTQSFFKAQKRFYIDNYSGRPFQVETTVKKQIVCLQRVEWVTSGVWFAQLNLQKKSVSLYQR